MIRALEPAPRTSFMPQPLEYTVQEVASLLKSPAPPRLLDVRETAEWDIAHLEGAQLITQALMDEILAAWAREAPIVCYCHHGVRSMSAAVFLRQQGFVNVRSMRGGIDAWAREVDPHLNRY
jgi:adenylyltransferase/sulfurtransferase